MSILSSESAAKLSNTAALIAKLRRYDVVSGEEVRTLEAAVVRTARFTAEDDIVTEGSSPTESCILLDGLAARYRVLESGTRQITAVHVPGDFIDLHTFLVRPIDHSITALSGCRVAYVPHLTLLDISNTHQHLTRLLWTTTLVDGAIHREWVVSMGRRSAVQQAGHLLCELYARLETVGLTFDHSFDLPVTQATFADIAGLSAVHMNRVIQSLRATGTVTWENNRVTITDWAGLVALAQFDPIYLGFNRPPQPPQG